jgi:2-oxoglutarate dehydrogenase E1 component
VFLEVISEVTDHGNVRRVLICSGKIYYDLKDERDRRGRTDAALVRLEQLYPFRDDLLIEELSRFSGVISYFWVQEEPENMGAWQHLRPMLTELCGSIRFLGRPADSCPAVGSHHLHQQQQAEIIKRAFEE